MMERFVIGRASTASTSTSNTRRSPPGAFSIAAGKTGTVKLALNPAGATLLRKDHGRLPASLTLSAPSASPPQTTTTSVSLVQQAEPHRDAAPSRSQQHPP